MSGLQILSDKEIDDLLSDISCGDLEFSEKRTEKLKKLRTIQRYLLAQLDKIDRQIEAL